MITFINIETFLNFVVISEKFNIPEYVRICTVVMKNVQSNVLLNDIIMYSLGALIHAFTIKLEHPILRKYKIYISSTSIK